MPGMGCWLEMHEWKRLKCFDAIDTEDAEKKRKRGRKGRKGREEVHVDTTNAKCKQKELSPCSAYLLRIALPSGGDACLGGPTRWMKEELSSKSTQVVQGNVTSEKERWTACALSVDEQGGRWEHEADLVKMKRGRSDVERAATAGQSERQRPRAASLKTEGARNIQTETNFIHQNPMFSPNCRSVLTFDTAQNTCCGAQRTFRTQAYPDRNSASSSLPSSLPVGP